MGYVVHLTSQLFNFLAAEYGRFGLYCSYANCFDIGGRTGWGGVQVLCRGSVPPQNPTAADTIQVLVPRSMKRQRDLVSFFKFTLGSKQPQDEQILVSLTLV